MVRVSRWLIASSVLFAAAAAHAGVIRIGGREVPLVPGSMVLYGADGSVEVSCDPGVVGCTGEQTQEPQGQRPVVNFARTDADPELEAGDAIALTWSATFTETCLASYTGPSGAVWSGSKGLAGSGESVTLSKPGDYVFSLRCFGDGGATSAPPVVLTVKAGTLPPPPPGCDIVDSNIAPAGWTRTDKTWKQAFSAPDGTPSASYPGAISWPTPIGSRRGGYTVIPFQPNENESVRLFWDRAQARLGEYETVRAAWGMYFTISPCPGDLRAPVHNSADPYLRPGCRRFESTAALVFSTKTMYGPSDDNFCKLDPTKSYYLTVSPVDPAGGITAGEHTCDEHPNTAVECHVGIVSGLSN